MAEAAQQNSTSTAPAHTCMEAGEFQRPARQHAFCWRGGALTGMRPLFVAFLQDRRLTATPSCALKVCCSSNMNCCWFGDVLGPSPARSAAQQCGSCSAHSPLDSGQRQEQKICLAVAPLQAASATCGSHAAAESTRTAKLTCSGTSLRSHTPLMPSLSGPQPMQLYASSSAPVCTRTVCVSWYLQDEHMQRHGGRSCADKMRAGFPQVGGACNTGDYALLLYRHCSPLVANMRLPCCRVV